MRLTPHGFVIASFLTFSIAEGSPVLLASLSGEGIWGGNQTPQAVESWFTTFGYIVETPGDNFSVALFEEHTSAVLVNSFLSVDLTAEAAAAQAFDQFAELLTDGISNTGSMIQSLILYDEVVGTLNMGGEEILDVHVPRFSNYDLLGYNVERIDLHMTYTIMSPGRDLNGDGVWTDFRAEGLIEIYGTAIPEPGMLTLLTLSTVVAVFRRR